MQDYYNLVDVYLDAVLYPNCVQDPKTFAQEGWHYELEKPEASHAPSPEPCTPSRVPYAHAAWALDHQSPCAC